MCGFAGFFDPAARTRDPVHALQRMGRAILHRGPDGSGEWFDPEVGVGLAHRRLSIIDLSNAGAQPMRSVCSRFVIVLNGEIYNFDLLRQELEASGHAPQWRGYSDTEVLLACIAAWGVGRTLIKCNGMFAFALWDGRNRELTLARDRFGEKPLYFGSRDGLLLFGSELKALNTFPGFTQRIDPAALALLLRFNYIPAPYCIWQDIHKLLPGTWVRFRARADAVEEVARRTYWSAADVGQSASRQRLDVTDTEAIDIVDGALRAAVGMRMRADVPMGAFLSGGIDSSVVVAAMQSQCMQPVQTFSISYRHSLYNEGGYARGVAEHLGTTHTELCVEPAQARDVIPMLPHIYDEPFADSSQIPTFLVSRLARSKVTVALSGDGGDELFGGYNRHVWAPKVWRRLRWMPRTARSAMSRGIRAMAPAKWDRILGTLARGVPVVGRVHAPGYKLHKFAGICDASDPIELYQRIISFWPDRDNPVAKSGFEGVPVLDRNAWPRDVTFSEAMMLRDTETYLPDDILVKVDRASMAVSLEARVPFLDPHLFELAWRLPSGIRVRGTSGKWVLRNVLSRYVPRQLFDRPKMGFGVPVGDWIRNELRDWAEDLLSEAALRRSGLLDPLPIRLLWKDHVGGSSDWEYHLWSILMFQSWLKDGTPS